ncbi:MAG TPA: flavodoxin family protein [Nannocystaceae bacterium]|nr:flavodoxin family protein [Nannocystaceae bacterium]
MAPRVVKGQPDPRIDAVEHRRRLRQLFDDPAFAPLSAEIDAIADVAYEAYAAGRKAPRTRAAGPGWADPSYELSLDWLAHKAAIDEARARHDDPDAPSRVLLVCASPRSDHTCPGEMSKSYRLLAHVQQVLAKDTELELDVLDLARLASEYGRTIHPCKGCVSTAMPLCHWPCSCYPNHALGQVHDWMGEIYPRWVRAHGVMIVTPVHWFQVPSTLKLMMDRLVCADGGNADPTRTRGKDPAKAKQVELAGWDYPKHLAGRAFAVVVHGDAEGVGAVRDALRSWLTTLGLVQASEQALLGRYVGYYEPYANSHDDLDRDQALLDEVGNAAHALASAVRFLRNGVAPAVEPRAEPRPK